MREIQGDLFEQRVDATCITTNGYVKTNGQAVMGRGVALQAAERWPDLPRHLGERIRQSGNHVGVLAHNEMAGWIVAFPVKYHWRKPANTDLIRQSTEELVMLARQMRWNTVALPRPGCGNGGLSWSVVRRILEHWLDDRFVVVER